MLKKITTFIKTPVATGIQFLVIFVSGYLGMNNGFMPGVCHDIELRDIEHLDKSAYIAALPDRYQTLYLLRLNKQLFEISEIPYDVKPPSWLEWSYVLNYLAELTAKRFPSIAMESRKQLGPASVSREEVESSGGGRYVIMREVVIFSASDSSDPSSNGRIYRLVVPYRMAKPALVLLAIITLCFMVTLAWRSFRLLYARSRIIRDQMPGAVISLFMVLIIWAVGEAYLRYKIPFLEVSWPRQFDEKLGYVFVPGATIRWTNKTDFWAENKVNSLGFPDREPVMPKPDDTFRILIIGDSFVEAAQVAIEKKFHVLLEKRLQDGEKRNIDTVAFGYSGTGQANQLSWLENLYRRVEPELVILLFVNNDFANNSPILESIRNGWSPEHAPRLFFKKDAPGEIIRQEIDKNWRVYSLPPADPIKGVSSIYAKRKELLSEHDIYREKLESWRFPSDLDMDFMFFTESPMPPVFEEALELTSYAIGQYKKLADQHNWSLMIVATEATTLYFGSLYSNENPENRTWVNELQWLRLKEIADQYGIPVLNLKPVFATYGDRDDAHFKNDGHWSETGHEWAARAIHEYLVQHPKLIQRRLNN